MSVFCFKMLHLHIFIMNIRGSLTYDESFAFVPRNSGEVKTVPDLSLSVREIFDRWQRNLPLDNLTRNGTFALSADEDYTDDALDGRDFESLDLVQQADIVESMSTKFKRNSKVSEDRVRETNNDTLTKPLEDTAKQVDAETIRKSNEVIVPPSRE